MKYGLRKVSALGLDVLHHISSRYARQRPDKDGQHLHVLEDLNVETVFIIGVARSGTSLLHHLLAETGAFNYVSTYHIFRYKELLDNKINQREQEAQKEVDDQIQSYNMLDRGVDSIKMSADSPEEYEMLLAKLCGYYKVVPASLPYVREIVKKVQYVSGNLDKSLLLKNPSDIFHLPCIRSSFPKAKFILLQRYPVHTINSIINFSISGFTKPNPYGRDLWPAYRFISSNPISFNIAKLVVASTLFNSRLRFATHVVLSAQKAILSDPVLNSDPDVVSVRYEDLCQDPNQTIKALLKTLSVSPTKAIDFTEHVSPRPVKLLPDVEENYHKLTHLFKPLIDYAGYQSMV